MTSTTVPFRADPHTLARACAAAAIGGAAILVLFVLPAEAGIDPTGAGRALGLTSFYTDGEEAEPAPAAAPARAPRVAVQPQTRDTILRTTPYRSDERTLTLTPHDGAEIKAEMRPGDTLAFAWTATGPVKMDMHGEASLTAESATTYWKQKRMSGAQGSFTAPFAGIHGWYWRNQGETPVTLTLRTSGFYAKLIRPPAS